MSDVFFLHPSEHEDQLLTLVIEIFYTKKAYCLISWKSDA